MYELKKRLLAAWILFGCGILVTLCASFYVKHGIEQAVFKQLTFSCDQATLKIQDRLNTYAMILRGGSALFAAKDAVSRDEWRAYVSTLHADQNVPGVQGIGYSQLIPQGRLAAHLARVRGEGFPDYTVRPVGERAITTSIIYLEPFRDRNLRAFGFDMFSEPVRRTAMEHARDSGEAALSSKVTLLQETAKEIQAGVLMYFPVYRRGEIPNALEQRREALIGWVYSPFRMNDLMTNTLSDLSDREGRAIDLHIYDGKSQSPANLLFDSTPSNTAKFNSALHLRRVIQFDQHTQWVLQFDAIATALSFDYTLAWVTLITGLAISGLLFGLMLSIVNTRANAAKIAAGLTSKISEISQRHTLAADSAHIGVWDYDVKENRLVWDKWMYALYGVCEENFSGAYQAWQQGLHPDDSVRGDREINDALSGEHAFDTEFRVVWPTGEVRYLKAAAMVLRNAEGDALRMIGVNYDITDRKRSEFALTERMEQLNNIFALSPDGFVSFDDTQRVKYVSPAFTEMTGLSFNEIIGLDENQFTEKMAAICISSHTFRSLDDLIFLNAADVSNKPQRELIELIVPAGRTLQVSVRTNNNVPVSKILHFRDVTYETEVDRMKSEFLSHAAHELRTPMSSILGGSEILLELELDAPTQRDLLETIHRQSLWLVEIIDGLLDLSRIDARRGQDLTIISVDIAELVQDTVTNMAVADERWKIMLDLPPGGIFVLTDIAKLRQALINIVSNSIKYSPEGGKIRLAISTVPGRVGITVSDQGIGMTPAQIQHYGDRFWRADASGNIAGTGLGVAIVKEILLLLGGSLEVSSQPAQGTQVTLWLPTHTA
ncbi:MAG: CHASE domain-containing protein [Nitrosomonadales bacterium]